MEPRRNGMDGNDGAFYGKPRLVAIIGRDGHRDKIPLLKGGEIQGVPLSVLDGPAVDLPSIEISHSFGG
jgi:hypothetical protein